jgi:hypothetical protein
LEKEKELNFISKNLFNILGINNSKQFTTKLKNFIPKDQLVRKIEEMNKISKKNKENKLESESSTEKEKSIEIITEER